MYSGYVSSHSNENALIPDRSSATWYEYDLSVLYICPYHRWLPDHKCSVSAWNPHRHTVTLGRYLIQSKPRTVVHPPAGHLLPWSYQLDMFHHTVCGWISHTRMKSTLIVIIIKKKHPLPQLLSALISATLLHMLYWAWILKLHPINMDVTGKVSSVGSCSEISCGSEIYVDTWQKNKDVK